MLFSKRIDEITYEDVLAFCKEGHEEGIRLDYKVDWPRDLTKVMAAMANTYGGLILIGVKEKERKPKLPLTGVDFTSRDQMSQKVTSIAYRGIHPPLFPEVAVCEFAKGRAKKGNRAIVVIRIPESHEAPHAIESGTKVYTRVASQTEPYKLEKLADIDTIQWFLNKRQKAVELRERLIKDAITRFRNYCAELAIQQLKDQPIPPKGKPDWVDDIPSAHRERLDQLEFLREQGTDNLKLLFFVAPAFPRDPLVTLDELYDWGKYPGEIHKVIGVFLNYEMPVPIPGGVKIINAPPKRHCPYVELNQFGLFCFFWEYEETNGTSLDPHDVRFYIHHSLKIATAFYEMLGFQGSLLLKVELTEALGKTLGRQGMKQFKYTAYQPTIHAFERQLYATEFHAQVDALHGEICKNVFWAFGWKAPDGWLERPQF